MLESFLIFKKEAPAEVLSCEVFLLGTPILKNISKRLLLNVFYKNAVLKNFTIFTEQK